MIGLLLVPVVILVFLALPILLLGFVIRVVVRLLLLPFRILAGVVGLAVGAASLALGLAFGVVGLLVGVGVLIGVAFLLPLVPLAILGLVVWLLARILLGRPAPLRPAA